MTKVMMMLGPYPFMLETAAYQTLKRTSAYRWKELPRIGAKPGQQYIGPGADQITLQGEILPFWKGGHGQIDLMRAQAGRGKPLTLLDGAEGYVLGTWLILKIDETQSEILANGIPQVVAFSLTLKEYGDDSGGFDALSFGIAALNTLSRLL